MKSEWRAVTLKDIVDFNPSELLKKGAVTKKIGMADILEHQRSIPTYEKTKYTSGTRFRNGDTLFARITPSLENGKIAQVNILDEDEVGFGSTEFIVWRYKDNISDPNFLFYLANYRPIVDAAIKSMVGTSGRQRVQLDVLQDYQYTCPPVSTQKAIADTLSCLDAKIEVNNRIMKNLEEQAQAIFKSWFIDFEPFRDGEFIESTLGNIPRDWKVGRLDDLMEITSGKRPGIREGLPINGIKVPVVGASKIMGYTNEVLFDDKIIVIGRVGTHGVIQRFDYPCWPSDNTLVIKSHFYEFVYQSLKLVNFSALNRGSTQPLITQSDLKSLEIVIPPHRVLEDYEKLASTLMSPARVNEKQNTTLATLRDTLLPKLMSGEIEVPIDQ